LLWLVDGGGVATGRRWWSPLRRKGSRPRPCWFVSNLSRTTWKTASGTLSGTESGFSRFFSLVFSSTSKIQFDPHYLT
jgi:hypothetical protein